MNIAIIFAAGVGQRFDDKMENIPKQFLEIDGKPILIHTLLNFQNHKMIDKIYIATLDKYIDYVYQLCEKFNILKLQKVVKGGACAMESIYNALKIAHEENDENSVVLIHDGVRPVITNEVIENNIKTTLEKGNAITAINCAETIIVSKDFKKANSVPIRKETFKAQAPQSFRLKEIFEAHNQIKEQGYEDIVDNCTLFMKLNKDVNLVEGNFGNIKITTQEDVYILKGILEFIKNKNNGTKWSR